MSFTYEVDEIVNGIAKIKFSDESFIYIKIQDGWTEADLDDEVFSAIPPHLQTSTGSISGLQTGTSRTAQAKPEPTPPAQTYVDQRKEEYGSLSEQLEYITENGLSAWQTKVAAIKAKYPKPADE